MRWQRSPTVLRTVRSLGSFLMIFSYSEMAFCSLPCWTNFSAALSTFCLLNPKPNAMRLRTPLILLTRAERLQNLETQKQVQISRHAGDIPERWSYGQGQLYDW